MQKAWYLSRFLKRVHPAAHASSAMRNEERLQKRLIIDRTLAADIFGPASCTEDGCLADPLYGDADRNNNRMNVHADERPADVDSGVGAGREALHKNRICHSVPSDGGKGSACVVGLRNGIDLFEVIALQNGPFDNECPV